MPCRVKAKIALLLGGDRLSFLVGIGNRSAASIALSHSCFQARSSLPPTARISRLAPRRGRGAALKAAPRRISSGFSGVAPHERANVSNTISIAAASSGRTSPCPGGERMRTPRRFAPGARGRRSGGAIATKRPTGRSRVIPDCGRERKGKELRFTLCRQSIALIESRQATYGSFPAMERRPG